MNNKIAQTYVWHGDQAFFVSTIDRLFGIPADPTGQYAETMVWEWDAATRTRGEMVGQDEDFQGSIRTHCIVVNNLRKYGTVETPEGDGE